MAIELYPQFSAIVLAKPPRLCYTAFKSINSFECSTAEPFLSGRFLARLPAKFLLF